MPLRFRRSKKIAPGIRLNASKRGLCVRLGPRGAGLSIGPSGTRVSAGIPGTGLYATEKISGSHAKRPARGGGRKFLGCGCLPWAIAIIGLLILLAAYAQ